MKEDLRTPDYELFRACLSHRCSHDTLRIKDKTSNQEFQSSNVEQISLFGLDKEIDGNNNLIKPYHTRSKAKFLLNWALAFAALCGIYLTLKGIRRKK